MAKNTRLANSVVNAQANALAEMLKDGFIDIYDGDLSRAWVDHHRAADRSLATLVVWRRLRQVFKPLFAGSSHFL